MNYKKIHLLSIFFILFYCLIIPGNNIYSNQQNIVDEKENERSLITSAPDATSWNYTWGTTGEDICHSTTIDSSDNICLAGYSTTNTSKDIAVIKYNCSGGKQWENLISVGTQENGNIILDLENNLYIKGRSDDVIYLAKYNGTNGYELWNWNYTWNPGNHTYLKYHFVTDTYNYTYLAWIQGYYYSCFYYWYGVLHLVKFNSTSGEQIWNCSRRNIGVYYSKMIIDSLDNIYLAGDFSGASYQKELYPINIIKYNGAGILQFNESFYGGGLAVRNIKLDFSNNIYIVGLAESGERYYFNNFLAKFNEFGQFQWKKEWTRIGKEYYDIITIDSYNNIYTTAYTSNRFFLLKYDTYGVRLWNITWSGGILVRSKSIVIDSVDNVYVAGEADYYNNSENDIILFKFNSLGNLDSIRLWGGRGNEEFNSILLDTSGNVYIAGTTTSYGAGLKDMFILKNPEKIIEGKENIAIQSYDLFILNIIIFFCLISLSIKQFISYNKRRKPIT